jgi:hypothetical protein
LQISIVAVDAIPIDALIATAYEGLMKVTTAIAIVETPPTIPVIKLKVFLLILYSLIIRYGELFNN